MAMTDGPDRARTMSYLTDQEAREFHAGFMMSFAAFTIVAVIAHILVWNWRPWFQDPTPVATAAAQVQSASVASTPRA